MEGQNENRILRAVVFSIGAALVLTAFVFVFTDVALTAARMIAVGLSGLVYRDAIFLSLVTFVLCSVGFFCMTLARRPHHHGPWGKVEKTQ